ncbi:MAG: hypothetical protein C4320_04300 [Armatimonadota bacterium]
MNTPALLNANTFLPTLPRLPAALPRAGVSADARIALKQLLGDQARALAVAFHNSAEAIDLARLRAQAVERVLRHCWTAYLGETFSAALFAVGGFGRGVLFPYSDVDLLALTDDAELAPMRRALEAFFGCLWDIGLKPGHAVRTSAQCREIAANDVSVFTNLLDARRIAGAQAFDTALRAIIDDAALWPPGEYLAAKCADRDTRHARHDDTTHNLEPDLKDGPGGLRSLDLIRWLGKRVAHAPDLDALVEKRLLESAERDALLDAERLGYRLTALTTVSLALHEAQPVERFRKAVQDIPEIVETYHVTGEFDFLLKILVHDMRHYEALLRTKILKIRGISQIKTSFVLGVTKHTTEVKV